MRYENQKQELLCPLLLVDVEGGGGCWLRLPLLSLAWLVIVVAPQAVSVTRPENIGVILSKKVFFNSTPKLSGVVNHTCFLKRSEK